MAKGLLVGVVVVGAGGAEAAGGGLGEQVRIDLVTAPGAEAEGAGVQSQAGGAGCWIGIPVEAVAKVVDQGWVEVVHRAVGSSSRTRWGPLR